MKPKRKQRGQPKRKERGLQDMFDVKLALVRDENQKATRDSGHALEDEVPSGTSRITPEHVHYQAPTSEAIPPVSSLKAWVRYHKCLQSGTFGQKCTLKTNHFVVTPLKEFLYQYEVHIRPEESCRINRAVISKLLYQQASEFPDIFPVYDGKKKLYTAGLLPFTCRSFEIDSRGILCNKLTRRRRERQFLVVLTFVARVKIQSSYMDLVWREEDVPLNIIVREIRHFQRYAESFQLGEGLEVLQDSYENLQLSQKGLLLNIDVSSTLVIKDMPVIDYIQQLLDRDILDRPLSGDDRSKINKALQGIEIQDIHTGSKHFVRGLTGSARELCISSGDRRTGKSFVEHFQETYNYNIQYTDLPCLRIHAGQRPPFLPMEVCIIKKRLRCSKQPNQDQMSALLEVARLHPGMRKERILEINKCDLYNKSAYAKEFGIKFENQLLSVDARVLPPPWLKFHDSKEFLPQVGRWNMIRKRMFHGGVVRNWTCVNFSWEVEDKIVSRFCHELAIMCQASGMDFSVDPVLSVETCNPEDVEWTLKSCLFDVMKKIEQQGRELDLLIVILPNNKGALYGNLKTICETDIGLVSQCCLAKHVLKMSKQYLANVALKINVKVGGKNTVLLDGFTRRLPCVGDIPTIILGAHVMHPGKSSSPSIAAVVASQDWPDVTNYAALASAQANGQELIQDLFHVPHDCETGAIDAAGMIREHLISFERATGHKPRRIIYYRDAVSNSQLYKVMWQELVAIKKACSYWEADYEPAVTYVVLQKCHHTCFFADYEDDKSFMGNGNVLPGTVVDSDICHPNEFGFYLCSQAGTQGTTRPVYYRMLWDENRFTADAFQCLTNYLCYTYARCTHSVSIVPPVYYAHLMASRGRAYMESMAPETRGEGHAPSSGASSSGAKSVMVRRIPVVKDNVKRVMFYC
ncbi:unnamed protein product [Urochloa decumbens]|uniref:Uncharacterized protein n=1 Tax=Urochloa decumbens TaxID=240449 RepID=A0ABC8VB84_9POAL